MPSGLPPELSKWAYLNDLKFKGNGLWVAWCPVCGNSGHLGDDPPDRFQIYEAGHGVSRKARGWCRRCGHLEFADDDPTNPWSKERKEELVQSRREHAAEENKRLQVKIQWLQHQTFWQDWHDHMTSMQRGMWHRQGMADWAIDIHKLGFAGDRYETCGGAYSIPYLKGQEIQTLQFRLVSPPHVSDKYRFEAGTSVAWFRPWPDDVIEGVVLVLEGAKKSLVAWQEGGQAKYRGKKVTMIATPSKNVPTRLFDELENAELIIFMLDPDAYKPEIQNGKTVRPAIERNILLANPDRSLVVRTVAKIDDMFIDHGLQANVFEQMINQAGPWRMPKQNA